MITVADLVNKITTVFDTTKVLSVDTVYEHIKDSDELKLIIFMNKVLYEDVNILYTKLIFITDANKTNVTKNYFTYLFDINCVYHRVEFTDLEDMSQKIIDVFKKTDFGDNIKILSKFIKSPATLINEWFRDNQYTGLSVVGFKYEPKIKIQPCKSLFFSFEIDLNNNQSVSLEVTKEADKVFILKFNVFDKFYTVEQPNLNNLVQVIGETLKNKIKV